MLETTYQTSNEDLIELHRILLDKLYLDNIQACNSKKELHFYINSISKYEALHKKFIKYGSKTATNFLIIDIDHINTPINDYKEEVIYKLGITPNWITRTDNGYHIGFILEDTLYLNNDLQKQKAIDIKKSLTNLLNGDIAGSHRLIGFWRNPLEHNSIINTEKLYTINELYKKTNNQYKNFFTLFDTEEEIQKKVKKTELPKLNLEKIDKQGFIDGNRNNFLFSKTIGLLYNGQIKNSEVEETIRSINNSELEEQEINRIIKSILKYDIKPISKNKEDYKRGEYFNDLWDNDIHNYKKDNKTEFARQKIGQKITTAKLIKNTLEKLVQGYLITYKNNQVFTNSNLENNTNLSKRTIQRYRNKKNLEQKIKNTAFKLFLESITKAEGVIATVTPIRELLNLALTELVFEYEKDNKKFVFEINEDNRLIFYELKTESKQKVA